MTIKEVSEKFDITADTLRYTRESGLSLLSLEMLVATGIIRKKMSIGLNTLYA